MRWLAHGDKKLFGFIKRKRIGFPVTDNQWFLHALILARSSLLNLLPVSYFKATARTRSEINIEESSSGNQVSVILHGYDAYSASSLSNIVGSSGKFYTNSFEKLTSRAVESCIDDFLNTLDNRFADMIVNGKSIVINIGFG